MNWQASSAALHRNMVAPLRLHSTETPWGSGVSERSKSSSFLTAWGTRDESAIRIFSAPIAGGEPADVGLTPPTRVTTRPECLRLAHLMRKARASGGAAGLQTQYGGVNRFLVGSTPAAFRQDL